MLVDSHTRLVSAMNYNRTGTAKKRAQCVVFFYVFVCLFVPFDLRELKFAELYLVEIMVLTRTSG